MKIFQFITLLFISFSLFFSSLANATMPCCMVKASQMQMDSSKTEMPCHKTEKTDKQSGHNKNCDFCKTCLNINAVVSSQTVYEVNFANISYNVSVNSFASVLPDGIYFPPKLS
jgi:hypothetical protein